MTTVPLGTEAGAQGLLPQAPSVCPSLFILAGNVPLPSNRTGISLYPSLSQWLSVRTCAFEVGRKKNCRQHSSICAGWLPRTGTSVAHRARGVPAAPAAAGGGGSTEAVVIKTVLEKPQQREESRTGPGPRGVELKLGGGARGQV